MAFLLELFSDGSSFARAGGRRHLLLLLALSTRMCHYLRLRRNGAAPYGGEFGSSRRDPGLLPVETSGEAPAPGIPGQAREQSAAPRGTSAATGRSEDGWLCPDLGREARRTSVMRHASRPACAGQGDSVVVGEDGSWRMTTPHHSDGVHMVPPAGPECRWPSIGLRAAARVRGISTPAEAAIFFGRPTAPPPIIGKETPGGQVTMLLHCRSMAMQICPLVPALTRYRPRASARIRR
jgi:hypothetical protein